MVGCGQETLAVCLECRIAPRTIGPKWGVFTNESSLVFGISASVSVSASPGRIPPATSPATDSPPTAPPLHPRALCLFSHTPLSGRSIQDRHKECYLFPETFLFQQDQNPNPQERGCGTAVGREVQKAALMFLRSDSLLWRDPCSLPGHCFCTMLPLPGGIEHGWPCTVHSSISPLPKCHP